MQNLHLIVIEQRTIWESITLIVLLDFLHDNFDITTTTFFHFGNNNLKEIEQIITSTEATNLAQQAARVTTYLAMMAKKKQLDTSDSKSRNNEECLNSGIKGHYAKDCHSSTSNKKSQRSYQKKFSELNRRKVTLRLSIQSTTMTTLTPSRI